MSIDKSVNINYKFWDVLLTFGKENELSGSCLYELIIKTLVIFTVECIEDCNSMEKVMDTITEYLSEMVDNYNNCEEAKKMFEQIINIKLKRMKEQE